MGYDCGMQEFHCYISACTVDCSPQSTDTVPCVCMWLSVAICMRHAVTYVWISCVLT
jgi:hypothetical protein